MKICNSSLFLSIFCYVLCMNAERMASIELANSNTDRLTQSQIRDKIDELNNFFNEKKIDKEVVLNKFKNKGYSCTKDSLELLRGISNNKEDSILILLCLILQTDNSDYINFFSPSIESEISNLLGDKVNYEEPKISPLNPNDDTNHINSIKCTASYFNLIAEKVASFLTLNTKLKKTKFSEDNNPRKYNLEMIQSDIRVINSTLRYNFDEDALREKRFIRLLWVFVIVMVFSFYCFICMKSAVDCASNSKTAINKIKESQAKEITEQFKKKNLIRNNIIESSD